MSKSKRTGRLTNPGTDQHVTGQTVVRDDGYPRSIFCTWKAHLSKPSEREKALVAAIMLFKDYHLKYPSHSYRWLNALALIHIPLCRWLAVLSLNKTGSRNSSSETE